MQIRSWRYVSAPRGLTFAALTMAASVLALAGCRLSSNTCPVGAEWCDCTTAGACDPGLSCVAGASATGKDRSCRKSSFGIAPVGPTGGGAPVGGSSAGHAWCKSMGGKAPTQETRGTFSKVWGTSWNDAWLISWRRFDLGVQVGPPTDPTVVISSGAHQSLVHWDGQTFCATQLSTPQLGLRGIPAINVLWGLTAGDVWAVGADNVALHWNGQTWQSQPSRFDTKSFVALTGNRSDNIFAIMHEASGGHLTRWDGKDWRYIGTLGSTTGDDSLWFDEAGHLWASSWIGKSGCHLTVDADRESPRCMLALGPAPSVKPTQVHGQGLTPWLVFYGSNYYIWRFEEGVQPGQLKFLRTYNTRTTIQVFSDSDVWAHSIEGGKITRWNGQGWSDISAPHLIGFWGRSSSDVWGFDYLSLHHWDGAAWKNAMQ
jgi:hypothetical protein